MHAPQMALMEWGPAHLRDGAPAPADLELADRPDDN